MSTQHIGSSDSGNFGFLKEHDPLFVELAGAAECVDNITQSILAKAFRGELTKDWRAANHDLISGDSSAEALLERIKAEREAKKRKKKAWVKKVKG